MLTLSAWDVAVAVVAETPSLLPPPLSLVPTAALVVTVRNGGLLCPLKAPREVLASPVRRPGDPPTVLPPAPLPAASPLPVAVAASPATGLLNARAPAAASALAWSITGDLAGRGEEALRWVDVSAPAPPAPPPAGLTVWDALLSAGTGDDRGPLFACFVDDFPDFEDLLSDLDVPFERVEAVGAGCHM